MRMPAILALLVTLLLWPARPAPALTLCLTNCSCTVSATPLVFGAYDPLSPGVVDGTSQVTVTCNVNSILGLLGAQVQVNYELALGGGTSGDPSARAMSSALHYRLYLDAARTVPWGDGSNGTGTITGSHIMIAVLNPQPASTTYTVYGRVPARQVVPVGSYVDAITVTLTY